MYIIGTVIWSAIIAVGLLYTAVGGNVHAKRNALIFGAFLTLSFELIVVNGAFVEKVKEAFPMAALHPVLLLGLLFSFTSFLAPVNTYAIAAGLASTVLSLLFLLRLGAIRTRVHPVSAVSLLQAFLKSWVMKDPQEIERYFGLYSKSEYVKTTVAKFLVPDKEVILVVPGVHPGPFYPVGSYNLSEKLHEALTSKNSFVLPLHGIGGHERNLPSRDQTDHYVEEVKKFVESSTLYRSTSDVRGPVQARIASANISCVSFADDLLITLSRAPYNSEDLDQEITSGAAAIAREFGLNPAFIDAHNSIDGETGPEAEPSEEEWRGLFQGLKSQPEHSFRVGYSHSSEIEFNHGSDISSAGIGVLVLEKERSRWVLVTVDANNAVSGLRESLSEQLGREGFILLELCTSDSHNFAARSPINRGYFALGEITKATDVINAIKRITHIAEKRLAVSRYSVGEFTLSIPLVGEESLDDFALVAKKGSDLAKRYAKIGTLVELGLMALTLLV